MSQLSLSQVLSNFQQTEQLDPKLVQLLLNVADACKVIASKVRQGALGGVLGLAGSENVQGEAQKKLDVLSNDIFVDAVMRSGACCGMVSEEVDDVISIEDAYDLGPYLIMFDPLDGSSNIDINVSIGSIFGVMPATRPKRQAVAEDFLRPGRDLVAAGYCMYGPQTQLVLTLGHGVRMFTLDPVTGIFYQVSEKIIIEKQAKEFAINMSNQRFWEAPVRRYIDELLQGAQGPRGKNFNMRWIAAMVAEVHRILQRGGVFSYPKDSRQPDRAGKLRLLYEANPMSMIIENAAGAATNGHQRILDMAPTSIHERVAVFLGAQEEVERVTMYHKASE